MTTDRLLHVCKTHPLPGDPQCQAGCVAFCGVVFVDSGAARVRPASPEDCVVCEDLYRKWLA